MKRKHQVLVTITFKRNVTEKLAKEVIERWIDVGMQDSQANFEMCVENEERFGDVLAPGTVIPLVFSSASRMSQGFKSRIKLLTQALRKLDPENELIS